MTTFTRAPEVREIADKLIAEHHTHLIDNGHVRIEYVFRSEANVTAGKTVWGSARKVSGLNAFLTLTGDSVPEGPPDQRTPEVEPFFVIEIASDVWAVLDRKQKVALVDHELSHCWLRPDGGLMIKAHDVEEFGAVLRRHGLWREDIEWFVRNLKGRQLSLLTQDSD